MGEALFVCPFHMIFRRSLISELANTTGSVFTVIFSIMLTIGLVRIFGMAAGGRIDPATVLEMVVYQTLINLAPILSVSLFISVLMTLMRSWLDSEMVVWFSSGGISLASWIGPVLRFSLPIVVLIALLSAVISPWSKAQSDANRDSFSQRDDVSRISPGHFIEGEGGRQVYFIEDVESDGKHIRNVFVMDAGSPDGEKLLTAQSGVIETNSLGDRYVTLSNGRRFELADNSARFGLAEFKEYSQRLDIKPEKVISDTDTSEMGFLSLLKVNNNEARGELFWRLSWPWTAINLVLIAIPLSSSNPRSGRKLNLIVALLLFVLYLNAISLGMNAIETGKIGFIPCLFLVNGVFSLLALYLFLRRSLTFALLRRKEKHA